MDGLIELATMGSPPRVRGTAAEQWPRWLWCWITPAGAGNSSLLTMMAESTGDHPRGCGEQSGKQRLFNTALGSPPRVRGTAPCLVIR